MKQLQHVEKLFSRYCFNLLEYQYHTLIKIFQIVYLYVYILGCRDKGGGRDASHCGECEGRDGAAAEGCHNVTLHYFTQHSAISVIVFFIHDA